MEYTNSGLVSYKKLSKCKTVGRKYSISRFTPHVFVGQVTAKQGCDYFYNVGVNANEDDDCSANYVIGKAGDIGLSVDEKDRAWTSSNADNDHRAITVEIASDTKHPYKITDEAWNALVELAVDVCRRNNKTKMIWIPNKAKALAYNPADNEMLITVHRWFKNKACPGDYLYNRLGELADTVNKRLSKPDLTDAQRWAVDNGLIAGYGNGDYGWGDPLTRGQLVIVLKRFYDLVNKNG